MSNSPLQLSEESRVANSLAAFVLDHPEIKDPFEMYNRWSEKKRYLDFPWGTNKFTAFCIETLDMMLNKMSRELLRDLYEDELLALKSYFQEQGVSTPK